MELVGATNAVLRLVSFQNLAWGEECTRGSWCAALFAMLWTGFLADISPSTTPHQQGGIRSWPGLERGLGLPPPVPQENALLSRDLSSHPHYSLKTLPGKSEHKQKRGRKETIEFRKGAFFA